MKAHWRQLNFQKGAHYTQHVVKASRTGTCKSIDFGRFGRCAILLKKNRTAKPPVMHLVMQGESLALAYFSAQCWEAPSVRWPIA